MKKMIATEIDEWIAPYSKNKDLVLSDSDFRKVMIKAKNGDNESREKIIGMHSKYIISMAKSVSNGNIVDSDLLSEGVIGALKAIDRFDMNVSNKFITYASYWIKMSMMDYISSMKDVYMPVNVSKKKVKVDKEIENQNKSGNVVCLKSVSKNLEMDRSEVELLAAANKNAMKFEDFENSDDIEMNVHEDIQKVSQPDYDIDKKRIMNLVYEEMKNLDDNVRIAISNKMGLSGEIKHYSKTAKEIGVSRNRLNALSEKGLSEMRMRLLSKGINVELIRDLRL